MSEINNKGFNQAIISKTSPDKSYLYEQYPFYTLNYEVSDNDVSNYLQ